MTRVCTFFSHTHGIFIKTDYVVGHETRERGEGKGGRGGEGEREEERAVYGDFIRNLNFILQEIFKIPPPPSPQNS
jgi:hypothetical protein